MLAKERFFQKGISPEEFKRTRITDIKDIMDIEQAWTQKSERERKINEALSSMK